MCEIFFYFSQIITIHQCYGHFSSPCVNVVYSYQKLHFSEISHESACKVHVRWDKQFGRPGESNICVGQL